MQVEVLYRPSYSVAKVMLAPNDAINAECGAMVGMSSDIQIDTKLRGGFLQSMARAAFGGESFFTNTFRAGVYGGEVLLAPDLPGDISSIQLTGNSMLAHSGCFLACDDEINVDTKWGGAKTFFGGDGLILLRCSGTGTLLLSSYGAIHEMSLAPGESYTVDTGHVVAFHEGMGFRVRNVGGLKSTMLSGEGLVVDLMGPGKVLLQTRSEQAFLAWLLPKLPNKSSD